MSAGESRRLPGALVGTGRAGPGRGERRTGRQAGVPGGDGEQPAERGDGANGRRAVPPVGGEGAHRGARALGAPLAGQRCGGGAPGAGPQDPEGSRGGGAPSHRPVPPARGPRGSLREAGARPVCSEGGPARCAPWGSLWLAPHKSLRLSRADFGKEKEVAPPPELTASQRSSSLSPRPVRAKSIPGVPQRRGHLHCLWWPRERAPCPGACALAEGAPARCSGSSACRSGGQPSPFVAAAACGAVDVAGTLRACVSRSAAHCRPPRAPASASGPERPLPLGGLRSALRGARRGRASAWWAAAGARGRSRSWPWRSSGGDSEGSGLHVPRVARGPLRPCSLPWSKGAQRPAEARGSPV